MKQILLDIIHLNSNYSGNGMYLGFYFLAVMILAFVFRNVKFKRALCLPNVILIVFVYFLFPVVNSVYEIDPDISVRAFWILMTPVAAALFLAYISFEIEDKKKRQCFILLMIPLIFFSGVFKISDSMFEKSENLYKLPSDVVDICEYILEERSNAEEDVNIVVPYEIAHVPRQISSHINMLFGENATYGRIAYEWDEDKVKACDEMITSLPNLNLINRVAKENNMEYIVFNSVYHEFGNESVNPGNYSEDPNFVGERTPTVTDENLYHIAVNEAEDGDKYWELENYGLNYVDSFGQYLLYKYNI